MSQSIGDDKSLMLDVNQVSVLKLDVSISSPLFVSFSTLALELLVQFKKLRSELLYSLGAGTSDSEEPIVFSSLLDFSEAIRLHKVGPVLLVWTHCQQAHSSVQIRVQLVVD